MVCSMTTIKFTVSREALFDILKEVSGLFFEKDIPLERIDPGSNKKIEFVSRVRFSLDGCRLALTSVSHGVRMERAMEVALNEPRQPVHADFVLDMSLLYKILKNKSLTKTLTCIIEDEHAVLLILSGKTEYVLEFKDKYDIPDAVPGPELENMATLKAGDLLRSIETVEFAAANRSDKRPEMVGVHLHTDSDLLVSVASNGQRVSRYAIAKPSNFEIDDGVTIPRASIPHIKRFLRGVGDLFDVGIYADATKLWLLSPTSRLLTCLVDRPYPDYKRLIRLDACPVSLDYTAFRDAVYQCSTFAAWKSVTVRVIDGEPGLAVESKSTLGDAQVFIDYEGEVGFPSHVGFNYMYMLDVLELGRELEIDFGDGQTPILLRGALDTELWAAIMPMRVGVSANA